MKTNRFWVKFILPPILLAVYPVLAILAFNIDQIDPVTALRPLVLSALGTVVLYVLMNLILNNPVKSSIVLSLFLVMFFLYGHIYNALENIFFLGFQLGRHRYLVPLWILTTLLVVWTALKIKRIPAAVTQAITVSAVFLFVFPIFQIANYYFSYSIVSLETKPPVLLPDSDLAAYDELPDVYLIILDSYARQDVLLEQYDFDNQQFIQDLESLGFYVAKCSLSNYEKTRLSLTSQLNFDFVQTLIGERPRSSSEVYIPFIKQSAVRRQFETIGYQTIAFESGYTFSELHDADLYLAPPGVSPTTAVVNPFEAMLLDTTALFPLMDLTAHEQIAENIFYLHYIRNHFVLDKLEEVPTFKGKKFVFAHIIPPHRPYILAADGSMQTDRDLYSAEWGIAVDDEHDRIGYRNQVSFLNRRLVQVLNKILDESEVDPVILLFSDHGVYPHRNANLAAYYLPGKGKDELYPTITSANSFRVVFNLYFGGEYELLPDNSYRVATDEFYTFKPYRDEMPSCQP